jgi:hypothetical protein
MMQSESEKTCKPIIGGIMVLISGVFGILGTLSYWIGLGEAGSFLGKGEIPPFIPSLMFGIPILALVFALLSIVGGIFILQRKKWKWSMICTIAAILSFILLGLPAIVMIALSLDEFT